MRVLVLALDGLDYKLIQRFKLSILKQKVWGTINLRNEFKDILSIIIWTSFITGLPPDEHGVLSPWIISSNRYVNKLFRWLRWHLPAVKNLTYYKIYKMLRRFGIKLRYVDKECLKKWGLNTIFDYASKPVAINVLGYNAKPIFEYLDKELPDLSDIGRDVEPLIWKQYYETKSLLLKSLTDDWDLMMVWINLIDWIQHLYLGNNILKVLKAYFEISKLVSDIKGKLNDNCCLLIVSDHGFQLSNGEPEHSTIAFYSFNINPPYKPKKITDFAKLINELLKVTEFNENSPHKYR